MAKRLGNTRKIVSDIHRDNPDWNATEVHEEYLKRIEHSPQAVQLSAIQKILEKLRIVTKEIEGTGENNPWDIGSLAKTPLNPEVVPILLKVQQRIINRKETPDSDDYPINGGQLITIGQAKWASRLFSSVATLLAKKPKAIEDSLVYWSCEYTLKEKTAKYSKVPFNSSGLDKKLCKHPDVSYETWLKKMGSYKIGDDASDIFSFMYPPQHGFPPTPINIDFAQRDKFRKKLKIQRAKEMAELEKEFINATEDKKKTNIKKDGE